MINEDKLQIFSLENIVDENDLEVEGKGSITSTTAVTTNQIESETSSKLTKLTFSSQEDPTKIPEFVSLDPQVEGQRESLSVTLDQIGTNSPLSPKDFSSLSNQGETETILPSQNKDKFEGNCYNPHGHDIDMVRYFNQACYYVN